MRSLHYFLIFVVACPAALGQSAGGEMNTLRVSAAAFADGSSSPATAQLGMEWMQAVSNRGILTGSLSLVQERGSVRAGQNAFSWHQDNGKGRTLTARAGTFSLNPFRFDTRNAAVYMPSALTEGLQTEVSRGASTYGVFAGAFTIEEGGRLPRTRTTSDRIAGAYAVRQLAQGLSAGIEIDRMGSLTQWRQSLQWKWKKTTVDAEYSLAGRGKPSLHMAVAHEGRRLGWSAAYVKRGLNYMPYGLMAYSADREGLSGEMSLQATRWLNFGGSYTRLRTNVARNDALPTARSRQYNVNTGVSLPWSFQLVLGHNVSSIARDKGGSFPRQFLAIDSVTLMHSRGMWITRVRADRLQIETGARSVTRGIDIDETRIFRNGLSLSGQVRLQNTRESGRHTARLSTAVRGSYEIGNRVSLNLQTEFGRDIRNETLFATSNLRTSSASVAIKLPQHSELRFEYYGTRMNYLLNTESAMASTLLGRIVTPVLSQSSRNTFYVRYQKTLRWRKPGGMASGLDAANLLLARPTGSVSGRICLDENENGACEPEEPGVARAEVRIGDRHSAPADEDGRYVVSGVGVGPQTVELGIETLNAAFTPSSNHQNVDVRLHATSAADFLVAATATVSGIVAEKKGNDLAPIADAAVKLVPSGRYAYTDSAGHFVISNVPRGEFQLELVRETLPENAEVVSRPSTLAVARPGQTVNGANFLVQTIEIQPVIERLPTERVRIQR